jgi:predicted PolB exonuclease-like 3'-5' exonuclease
MLKDLLILDIETVPGVSSYNLLDDNWKTLWEDKISKTVPENVTVEEMYYKRAGILAEFGKIVCISTAFIVEDSQQNKNLRIKSIYGDDEKEILTSFIQLCNKMYQHNKQFIFGGHNIKEFDIPYICRRILINQLALPEYLQLHDKKPWETKMFDTLSWWKFGDNKNYTSLHLLANVLGIPTSKTDIDGSKVQTVYYEENNLQRIVDYCERDVVVTANIILRFHNLPLLQATDIVIVGN